MVMYQDLVSDYANVVEVTIDLLASKYTHLANEVLSKLLHVSVMSE